MLKVSLLLSSLNYVSVDTVDDEGSVEFSPNTDLRSPLCVHITIDTEAESLHTTATVFEIC